MNVVHGFHLRIPRGHRSPVVLALHLDGEYEKEESRLISELINPGDLVFDIGANIGYTTCLMAQAVVGASGGEVHAFEPEPKNFEILQQNVVLNEFDCVILNRLGLASSSGSASIYLSEQNQADHTLVHMPGREAIPVETVTFDDYYAAHCAGRRVRLVKIDVQGFEYEVLHGMRESLHDGRIDTVLLELWPARMKRTGTATVRFLELITQLLYEATIISDTGGGKFGDVKAIRVAPEMTEEDPHLSFNILLQRRL
ncbi:MAG: FkbM family methyltransferase [bacterium]|nr:FkbM family methyltransferase [bacterium]